jgi:hypothetical protein
MHRDPLCSRAAGEFYFRSRVAVNLQNLTVFEAKPSMAMQQSRIASDHCVDGRRVSRLSNMFSVTDS